MSDRMQRAGEFLSRHKISAQSIDMEQLVERFLEIGRAHV